MSRPWMPLYIADYRADTMRLSTVEHGAYLLLIMEYWRARGLPNDDKQLARIVGLPSAQWKKMRPTVQAFFHDGWKHKRIDDELIKAAKVAEGSSERARHAASKRWCKDAPSNAPSMPDASSEQCLSNAPECTLHTSQSKEDKAELRSADDADEKYAFDGGVIRLSRKHFSEWVKAYPSLDLRGELTARDAWLASDRATDSDRRNWFISTSKYLANRSMEARAKTSALQPAQQRGIAGII
jgi:uncharacterized protein YdaU (DUF1376 family)